MARNATDRQAARHGPGTTEDLTLTLSRSPGVGLTVNADVRIAWEVVGEGDDGLDTMLALILPEDDH